MLTPPLFTLPIPASRGHCSHCLQLRDARPEWLEPLSPLSRPPGLLVLTGMVYGIAKSAEWPFPARASYRLPLDRSWHAFREVIAKYLRRAPPDEAEAHLYNVMSGQPQPGVIFVLFPLIIWTGLALLARLRLRSFPLAVAVPWAAGNPRAHSISSSLGFLVHLPGDPRGHGPILAYSTTRMRIYDHGSRPRALRRAPRCSRRSGPTMKPISRRSPHHHRHCGHRGCWQVSP